MSKKEKKCHCENETEKIKTNEECNCQHEECNCQNEECQCHEEECNCENENSECTCKESIVEDESLQKIKSLEEALLRNQAELLNYKKRKDEETSRILKYSEKDILEEFLPILDNFERAIKMDDNNFGDETSKFLEGFRMVYNQTRALLEKHEVKEIECLGKEFDPAYAQAVVVEKDSTKESGIVLEVLQKGYMYKDRVLRTAMVKVNE